MLAAASTASRDTKIGRFSSKRGVPRLRQCADIDSTHHVTQLHAHTKQWRKSPLLCLAGLYRRFSATLEQQPHETTQFALLGNPVPAGRTHSGSTQPAAAREVRLDQGECGLLGDTRGAIRISGCLTGPHRKVANPVSADPSISSELAAPSGCCRLFCSPCLGNDPRQVVGPRCGYGGPVRTLRAKRVS